MKKTKLTIEDLLEGRQPLNNQPPPKWLKDAVGEDVAWAVMLFEASHISDENRTIRFNDETTKSLD